ncbi:hypothetical protein C8J56DRAFT_26823 [Mycena floridula]|nr:hypothetical protein C8J56DRAFT_26823 [Mycena floridula]
MIERFRHLFDFGGQVLFTWRVCCEFKSLDNRILIIAAFDTLVDVRHELGSSGLPPIHGSEKVYHTAFKLLLSTAMQPSETTLVWADHVLLTSSVLYLYDFCLTISEEWEIIRSLIWRRVGSRRRHLSLAIGLPFAAVRYTALVYYLYIIYALATWTPSM